MLRKLGKSKSRKQGRPHDQDSGNARRRSTYAYRPDRTTHVHDVCGARCLVLVRSAPQIRPSSFTTTCLDQLGCGRSTAAATHTLTQRRRRDSRHLASRHSTHTRVHAAAPSSTHPSRFALVGPFPLMACWHARCIPWGHWRAPHHRRRRKQSSTSARSACRCQPAHATRASRHHRSRRRRKAHRTLLGW